MKSSRIALLLALALAVAATLLAFGSFAQQDRASLNMAAYYPLATGNAWTYQVKQYRADGQIAYRLRTQSVEGEVKLDDKTVAKKLMDDRGKYYLIAVDERRFRVFGENDGKGEVKYSPAYTVLDTAYTPGKAYATPHTVSDGNNVSSEATFYGVESVSTPAGAFKDCLKVRFQQVRPSGATMTITSYLAKGLGIVKETYEFFSPAAEQTLRNEIELLHAVVGGKKLGGEAAQTVKIAEYFPYHQGDSWTYDWTYKFANGQARTSERKRWFEGTKFTNAGASFKLVQNTGDEDYQFYVLDKNGLRIMESGEKGQRAQGVKFYYEPALLLGRDDMVLGRTYRWSQPEADGKYLMQFSTTLEGFETVVTPMGQYENCLRTRVEWETSTARVKNMYFYARGVGMVAYDYEVVTKNTNTQQIALTGRLKAATINNNNVTTAEEGKKLWDKMAAEMAATEDNPVARNLFKEASLNRYVWDADLGFRGFTADMTVKIDGGAPLPVKVHVSPTLDVEIDAPDPTTKAYVHEEMSQFVTHRQPRKPFDAWYGPDKAKFKLGKETPEGREVFIEGDSMGSNYVIGNKQVRQLGRNIGRMDFTIFQRKLMNVEDGRYIALEYEAIYYKVGTKEEVGREWVNDTYVKQGNYWVPKGRTHKIAMKGRPSLVEVDITKLEYLK
ncbi:MAG: DUF3386 family protein [Acidobacteria bacterium]|nr:DUF3386 family protein [Acidobacteriota bacterium]MBI3424532.1 DUF3386 family protein [Acidobacteriota bacterium]